MSYRDIPGYSGFLPLYEQWIAQAKDGDIAVEVGVALGHSLAYLARLIIDSGKMIELWAVDPWGGYARNGEQQTALGADPGPGDFTLFLESMRAHAPEEMDIVRVVRAESVMAARMFEAGTVGLVMIDGAHDFQSVVDDIMAWRPIVATGGWLCGDDHEPTYPGVEQACAQTFGTGNYGVFGTSWRKVLE